MRDLIICSDFDAKHDWSAETGQNDTIVTTTLLGPQLTPRGPFTEVVPSWSAETPPGTWIEVQLSARRGRRWTAYYRMAQWDSLPSDSRRQSFGAQRDADGRVATDTLVLAEPADAVRPRILLCGTAGELPQLRALSLAFSGPGADAVANVALAPRELAVPPRAQLDYPNGPNICSPTSVAMLLAYWYAQTGDPRLAPFAERQAVPELVAPQVYDPMYEGHGNWSFNTAFAASLGLEAFVARFASLADLAPWLAAGVPVVISVGWQVGALDNAPIESSNGHLLVVCGFDERGRAIVADPRGDSEAEVRRVYDAAQLAAAWQGKSKGTAYIIYPQGWPAPSATMA